MPTIPPNNNTGLYGIDGSSVAISNDVTVDNLAATGNITAGGYIAAVGNISSQGNVSANYFIGDGSQLTNLPGGSYGNANVSAYLASGTNTANVVTTGNVSGQFILGNGSQLTGLPATYSNANVATFMAAFGSNTISTTGNVTAGYFIGDGSLLTGLPASYGNANVAAFLPTYTGNLTGGNLAVGNNASVGGNLSVTGTIFGTFAGNISGNLVVPGSNTDVLFNNSGNAGASTNFRFNSDTNTMLLNGTANVGVLNATGNVTSANIVASANAVVGGINTDNYRYANGVPVSFGGTYGNANVADFLDSFGSNAIVTTGNITGGNIIGNGQSLTNLPGANVVGAVANATFATSAATAASADSVAGANVTGTVASATQANTANVANSVSGANVTGTVANATQAATANVANSVAGGNVTGQVANALVAGTVYTNAQPNITSLGTLSALSVTGNITTGGILTNGYYYANGTPVTFGGGSTYGDSNVTTLLAAFGSNVITTTGNITGSNINTSTVQALNSGGLSLKNSAGATQMSMGGGGGDNISINVSTNINGANAQIDISPTGSGHVFIRPTGGNSVQIQPTTAGSINNMVIGNITPAAVSATTVSATGNITGANINGNGSGLTSLTGANVTGTVASATQANLANTANAVAGGNVSGQVANALVAGTVYTAAQPAITSVGTLTSLSVSGNVVPGGINTNNYRYANGTPVSFEGTYGNANVSNYLASGTNTANIITTGNIQGNVLKTSGSSGNITGVDYIFANAVVANATIQSTGRITAGAVTYANTDGTAGQVLTTYGNGLTYFASTASTYGNANVTTLLASFGSNTISTTGNITGGNFIGNGGSLSTLSVSGNVATGGINTDNYRYANGTPVSFAGTPGGSDSQIQYNNGGAFGGNAAMTFNDTTGNVVLGNIVTNTNTIQTVGAIDYPNVTASADVVPWRIVMGNAYNGSANSSVVNTSPGTLVSTMNSPRLLVADLVSLPNNGMRINEAAFVNWAIPTANISNNSTRIVASRSEMMIGGSTNNYAVTATSPFLLGAHTSQIYIGAGTNANLSAVGNVAVAGGAIGMFVGVNTQPGSSVVFSTGSLSQIVATDTAGVFGNATNQIAYTTHLTGAPANANVTGTTTSVAYYHPPAVGTSTGVYGTGITTGNIARQATTYHAFRNDDDLARSRLGALERMHFLTANVTSSSGSVTIDKNNGQVQQVYLTENITGATFSNFAVRQQRPNATFQNSTDEVTLIFQQGATAYDIALPTGNAAIRYANGVSTVTGVANTTVIVDVVGVYNYNTSATNYLVTVNPTFS